MPLPPEDEWFSEPEASPSPSELRPPAEDNWFASADAPRSTFDGWLLVNQRLLVAASVAVVVLVAILAIAGVFSSSSPGTPAASLTTTTAPVTSTTTAARPSATPPTTTLKPGDSGPQVKALQRELGSLGYSVGAIDGNYGPATTREVAAFQRSDRLKADGIVGPATLLALAP